MKSRLLSFLYSKVDTIRGFQDEIRKDSKLFILLRDAQLEASDDFANYRFQFIKRELLANAVSWA